MTPTQRAAAERLADELQRFDGAERESLRDEAAALLRELAAEPVAWQLPGTDSILTASAKKHHGVRAEAYTEPLYAHPPQQHQPLDYFRVQEIAQARRIGYNELSAALRDYLDITGDKE